MVRAYQIFFSGIFLKCNYVYLIYFHNLLSVKCGYYPTDKQRNITARNSVMKRPIPKTIRKDQFKRPIFISVDSR